MREQLRNRVWDSLIAAFLAPRVLPHDRGELVAVLRALHLVEIVDELRLDDDLRDLAGATPVIPAWAWKEEDGPRSGTQPAEPAQGPLDQVNRMRQEIVGVDDAPDDIQRAYLEVIREPHGRQRARRPPSGTTTTKAPDRPTPTSARIPTADTGRPPWRPQPVAGRLALETKTLLARIDRGSSGHRRARGLPATGELLYRRLEQADGRAATVGLGILDAAGGQAGDRPGAPPAATARSSRPSA